VFLEMGKRACQLTRLAAGASRFIPSDYHD
jgi:hypothetical protein